MHGRMKGISKQPCKSALPGHDLYKDHHPLLVQHSTRWLVPAHAARTESCGPAQRSQRSPATIKSGLPCLITMKEGPPVPAVATLNLMTRVNPCSCKKVGQQNGGQHFAGHQQVAASQQNKMYNVSVDDMIIGPTGCALSDHTRLPAAAAGSHHWRHLAGSHHTPAAADP